MTKKFVLVAEDLSLAESAMILDTVDLHLVPEPFVDIAKQLRIAIGKSTHVTSKIRKDMPFPGFFGLEPLHTEAEMAFYLFFLSNPQVGELWDLR
jgi:hypothetical protein